MSTAELVARVHSSKDYFETLGVTREATTAELTKAYRKLALRLHPDKCQEEGAEDAFKKVSSAFACLRDEESRAHYERFGSEPGSAVGTPFRGAVDPNELFRAMFEAAMRAEQERAAAGGGRGHAPQAAFFSLGTGSGSAFSVNGRPIQEFFPNWLRTVLGILPPQVVTLGFASLLIFSFSHLVALVAPLLPYYIAIVMFIPPPLRGFCLVLTFVLSIAGFI